MRCQDYAVDIGDLVDGTLEGPAREACVAHVDDCAACRALVADLQAIREAARGLVPVEPPAQAFGRIAAALDTERARRGTWGLTWQTAGAAAATVILTVSLAWVGGRFQSTGASPADPGLSPVVSVKEELDLAEARYASAIAGLESIALTGRESLDTDMADVLQANLSVIDGAITESRAALVSEPDSEAAQDSLFEALRSKLELLQDVVALINEMRKGNQEGAARIVSELNQ